MSTQAQTAADIRNNLAENLDWRLEERNDTQVAQAIYQGEPVDAVHTLDEPWALVDASVYRHLMKIRMDKCTYLSKLLYRIFGGDYQWESIYSQKISPLCSKPMMIQEYR